MQSIRIAFFSLISLKPNRRPFLIGGRKLPLWQHVASFRCPTQEVLIGGNPYWLLHFTVVHNHDFPVGVCINIIIYVM